jgi:ectoine hydroxylase-related dioxygenase (phytanoyl-CoA dioxygenase family)
MEKECNHFSENGYLTIENVLSSESINELFVCFISLMARYCDKEFLKYQENSDFSSQDLSKLIILHKRQNNKGIGIVYSVIKETAIWKEVFTQKNILDIVSPILGTTKEFIVQSDYQFRMDYPKDSKHTLGWHQDSAYYPHDTDGTCGIVCNLSLHDITCKMGCVEVLAGSYQNQKLDYELTKRQNGSEQRKPVEEVLEDERNILSLETKKGDLSLYSMNLIHRSGFNKSEFVRFSALTRMYNSESAKFMPFSTHGLPL